MPLIRKERFPQVIMLVRKGGVQLSETTFSIKHGRPRTLAKGEKIDPVEIQELEPQGILGPHGREDCAQENVEKARV